MQFAAAVGLSNCPGAPRLDFFLGQWFINQVYSTQLKDVLRAGREAAKIAAPEDSIPEPFGSSCYRTYETLND